MSRFETAPSFPGATTPTDARAVVTSERQQAPRERLADTDRYSPALSPPPSFLAVLLRALAAWNT